MTSREIIASIRGLVAPHLLVFNERELVKIAAAPFREIQAAPGEARLEFVFEALYTLPHADSFQLALTLKGFISSLLRGGLPLTPTTAIQLVSAVSAPRVSFPFKGVLTALETVALTPELAAALRQLRTQIDEWHGGAEMRDLHGRIDKLLAGGETASVPVAAAGAWSSKVLEEIATRPNAAAWLALFDHARTLTQSAAPRKWQAAAVQLIDRIGRADVLASAPRWLGLGPMPGCSSQLQTPDAEADLQKGFVWALGALGDASLAPAIADFALACLRKIPQIGAVSHRVGNACVNALAIMPGLGAVSQLSRLATRIKYDVARKLIEKALAEAAARNHVTRDDLEAMSVPDCGLDAGGTCTERDADGYEARLSIAPDGTAELAWSHGGNPLKSAPKNELGKECKQAAKELDAMLSTQRIRLERLLLSPDTTRFADWRDWYIDHPVVGFFARRLIWEIDGQAALRFNGQLVDWAAQPIATPAPDAPVRLWHPIRATAQDVLSWRCFLEDRGIQQPFKQAHREVYVLTDAERETHTYSNRFAAHILRQHQFAALCRERGWQFSLMGQWDSHNIPYLDLPRYALRAQFHVDFSPSEETSGHAIYLTISSNGIQFVNPAGVAQPLDHVPPVVFSEVMRDGDLFTGVTSIGADPEWGVRYPHSTHLAHWNDRLFGELTTASENRREVLAALLPKLTAIASRCRLEGRFLIVRGDLAEYHIHLGSGNVRMEPGSRYLCIVQGADDTAATLPLPFEGDRMLAVILSKAFLLAADKKIKDETIRRQLAL